MFTKILVATDGSAHADRAAEKALYLAQNLPDCTVTLLHVTKTMPPKGKLIEANFDVLSLLEEAAHEAIRETETRFQLPGIQYKLDVAWGDPAYEIIQLAEQGGYDLIMIGSRGLGRMGEILLGSVSQTVLHDSKIPVMVIK